MNKEMLKNHSFLTRRFDFGLRSNWMHVVYIYIYIYGNP